MTGKTTVELTRKERVEAASALLAELERQRVNPTRSAQDIAAIQRAMIKLYER